VLEDFDTEIEEAARSLGATQWQSTWRVIVPAILPALFTGFTLAFARGLGEYGAVVFISGNLPNTQITSLLINTKLEEYKYLDATAVAVVMLVMSFVLLLIINMIQARSRRFQETS
jgi:sulfate/thiosulfate transport system permease protein